MLQQNIDLPTVRDTIFVGGKWVKPESDATTEVISPFTEQVIATVPSGSSADIDRAVGAARVAFEEGGWAHAPLDERVDALRRLSASFEKNRDLLAQLVSEQMGCPITLSETVQAGLPRQILDSYIDLAADYPWEEFRSAPNGRALVRRAPAGVVGAILPWNSPQLIAMLKLAPALLAGCAVVIKPAPETPLDAFLLAEMVQEAGIPDGVVNVVTAGREASESLVTHPGVDKISFTGSATAGRRIASLCGQDLRRVTLELGGKSAGIVLDDADLQTTAESLAVAFRNSGQACNAKTRILVSRKREEELLARLSEKAADLVVGDPSDRATDIGPLVTKIQREKVEQYISTGVHQGGRIVAGGGRPAGQDRGWFVEPTIVADVAPDSVIAREEIFGPVVSVIRYEDEADALRIANDSDYGLSGAVYSADIGHAVAVASRIRTGTVEINGNPAGSAAPMGGFKNSGIGREYGPEGIDAYIEYQSIGIPASYADSFQ